MVKYKTINIKIMNTISLIALIFLFFYSSTINAQSYDSKIVNVPLKSKNGDIPVNDIQRFTTIIEHIKNYYVNDVKDEELFENAIRGMLSGLDPHSSYLDQDEFSDLKLATTGKFGGLGIEVTLQDGFIRVIAPIDDTPAKKAGIEAGDIIIKLDDTPVKGLSLREAVDIMRGDKGEPITLTIIREGQAKPLVLKVVRDIISIKSVKSKLLEDNYGYIRISNFQNDTGSELISSIKNLKKETNNNLQGLILDLRNNPGGVLEASVQVASSFLDSKKLKHDQLVVYTKGKLPNSQIKEKAHGNDLLNGIPIVVLVNQGSASASEIVAGALQDHNRAIIVGTETFGKGSVQTILPLRGERGIKLTTALYYTPAGRSIQAMGIVPDIKVENINIPKPKEEPTNLFISEKDLQHHLENGKDKDKKDSDKIKIKERKSDKPESKNNRDSKSDKEELPLIYRDYQLYEALNILKTADLMKK